MYFNTKAFLTFILACVAFLRVSAFQGKDPDVDWYESFFQEKKLPPVERALGEASQKLRLASERQDMTQKVKALNELSLLHLTRTHVYEQAMDFLIRALTIEDSLGLKNEKIFTFLVMARVFEAAGNYYKSAEILEEGRTLSEQVNNPHIVALLLNELGKVHAAMGNLEEAFDNYEQVLEYKNQINDPAVEAEALFNLAHLYQIQGKYPEALRDHKRSLGIRRSVNDKKNEALSLNDIGQLYQLMNNAKKALANHQAALDIRKALHDKTGLAESYNNIGVLYYQQKNFQRARENLNIALSLAQESQAQHQIRKSYEYLSLCHSAMNDYKTALYFKNLFLEINEFIQNDENEQQVLEAQNRYVIDNKELLIEKLEADSTKKEIEIHDQKRFRNILMIFIGLSLVIVMLIFYLYIVKRSSNRFLQTVNEKVRQQNAALQELNATKDKFFSIISHDLKGPLNSFTSFSSLLVNHGSSLSRDEIQMLAKDLDKSLKNLFALLENLLEWAGSQTGTIEFTPSVFDITSLLMENIELLSVQAQNKNIKMLYNSPGKLVVKAHRPSVNTVVRNLLSNAIKFTPVNGFITLNANRHNNLIITSISDTGVGMSPEIIAKLFRIDTKHSTKGTAQEKGTGLGLILCKEFIDKNGGRIWVQSEIEKGSSFYFSLPADTDTQ